MRCYHAPWWPETAVSYAEGGGGGDGAREVVCFGLGGEGGPYFVLVGVKGDFVAGAGECLHCWAVDLEGAGVSGVFCGGVCMSLLLLRVAVGMV